MADELETCDVLVIGTGSAACAAALKAAKGGLKVVAIEKTDWLGGTSAMSGAGIWIPSNHLAAAEGLVDTREDALTYIRAASPDGWEETEGELWVAFADNAPRMLAFVEENTPITFKLVQEPDPMAERPGGKLFGRMVSPMPLSRNILGRYARHLRRSTLPHSFTYQEIVDNDLYHHPLRAGFKLWPKLLWRKITNAGGQGTALMAGLIRGCLDAGVTFHLMTSAQHLIEDESGGIAGAEVEHQGERREIRASRGVVLATGGFEWDSAMREAHFPGPVDRLGSPRTNTGDGQRMAAEVGAKLDRMDQANIYPSLPTRYQGRPHGLPMTFQAEPHSIVVNRHGHRFVSETDYNIGEAMDQRDPKTGHPIHLPCFLVGDHRFLKSALPFRWYSSYERNWVKKAATLDGLAKELGLPAAQLRQTVDHFNTLCDKGRDTDFRRGESGWESYKAHGLVSNLGRIDKPPFIGMSLNRSFLGTKGGARTNAAGQVVRPDGSIIPGLYAAGLSMANPIGTRAIGAGTTIGPNLTWGFIAAETMLKQNR